MSNNPNSEIYIEGLLESRLEKNRQLLTLSTLVIGFLLGVFDTDDLSGVTAFAIWAISSLCFLICAVVTLLFFAKNTVYLENIVAGTGKEGELKKELDKISVISTVLFIAGIITLIALVVYESKFMVRKELDHDEAKIYLQINLT